MSKKRGEKPKGDSKYQKKIKARAREARKLGLPSNTPYPILNALKEE